MTVDDDMDDEDTHQVRVPTRDRARATAAQALTSPLLATRFRARAQTLGRPKDALDMMNSQQLQYTKKMEKQRRRVHELEEKDAHMRSAIHQRKQFLAKATAAARPRAARSERGSLSLSLPPVSQQFNESGTNNFTMKMKAAIARLENRLEKCFNRQNLTEAMNKQLKLSIDDLRYEKQQLLRSNAKGEQQLAKRKGQLRHAMTETNRVMDLKEQIKRELESLKVSTMAEIDEFTETFEGLSSGLHEAMDTSKTREAHKAADAARDGALVVSKSSKTKKVEDDAAAQERKKLDMDEMRDETMKACVRDCAGAEPVPLVCAIALRVRF